MNQVQSLGPSKTSDSGSSPNDTIYLCNFRVGGKEEKICTGSNNPLSTSLKATQFFFPSSPSFTTCHLWVLSSESYIGPFIKFWIACSLLNDAKKLFLTSFLLESFVSPLHFLSVRVRSLPGLVTHWLANWQTHALVLINDIWKLFCLYLELCYLELV